MGITFQKCHDLSFVNLGYTLNRRQPDLGKLVRLEFVFTLTDNYTEESKISN
jgi:hypothetical protein